MKLQYKKYMIFLLGIAILTLGVSMTVKSDIGAGSYDSINFAIADILTLHAYASSTISKQEAAILTYSAYKDKAMDESGLIEKQKLYTYCKRSAKSYVESILDQNKDKNIVQVLNAGLLSNKALKDLMDEVDENSILRPYILETMQKTKHAQLKKFNI